MNYNTITKNGNSLFKEKGSKHFGYAYPIINEQQAKVHLEQLQSEHGKANHICYAYKLGTDGNDFRMNDDGEPSGSAGKPIMGQLEHFEITNVLVAVVRYFGGTKLGVAGLQKAYKTAAKEAILDTEIITKDIETAAALHFPFDKQGEVDYLLKNLDVQVTDKKFTTEVSYGILLPEKNKVQFIQQLQSWHEVSYTLGDEA
jgi:uncharacterized YigZ family protein